MKRIIALLLTVLMVFGLCACGQSAAPAPAEAPANNEPAPAAEPETPAAEEPQAYDYSGQKLVIWTCLTADAQYEVLNKQFTELGKEMGVDVEVERLSFNGLGCRLFHLLLGKMDQQVGHKKYRIIVIFSHAQYHCLPALFDDDAVNSQRYRGKLVFFDSSVVVGVQIGDAAVLIERILFDVEPGGIDMRTQNVHAALKGLCADLEKDHGFVHPHAVDLISGR